MRHRGLTLAVRVQQVGQVGVQRRHPVLVAELAAQLEGLRCRGQGFRTASGLGQQEGVVARRERRRELNPSRGCWRALAGTVDPWGSL